MMSKCVFPRPCKPPYIYFGGKHYMLDLILPFLPTEPKWSFVEPFFGAGNVFFGKYTQYKVEVINDLDDMVVNCMRVLQDKDTFEKIRHRLEYTPFAMQEFVKSIEILKNKTKYSNLDLAWAFLVNQGMGFSGHGGKNPGDFGRAISISNNQARALSSKFNLIKYCHEKIKNATIEHDDGLKIIKLYDSTNTFFYLDPPYPIKTRKLGKYNIEMDDKQHIDLIDYLLKIKGHALLSSYETDNYNRLLDNGWHIVKKNICCHSEARTSSNGLKNTKRSTREECLYMTDSIYSQQGYLF